MPCGYIGYNNAAYTQKVNFENVMDTLKQRIALAGVKGAKFVPGAIDLTLPVDIYTEKTVEVLLRGINFPADKVLRAFPSKFRLRFKLD